MELQTPLSQTPLSFRKPRTHFETANEHNAQVSATAASLRGYALMINTAGVATRFPDQCLKDQINPKVVAIYHLLV